MMHDLPFSAKLETLIPEYLNKVLKDLFGPSYSEIVNSVSKYLEEFSYQRPIVEFLHKIK